MALQKRRPGTLPRSPPPRSRQPRCPRFFSSRSGDLSAVSFRLLANQDFPPLAVHVRADEVLEAVRVGRNRFLAAIPEALFLGELVALRDPPPRTCGEGKSAG